MNVHSFLVERVEEDRCSEITTKRMNSLEHKCSIAATTNHVSCVEADFAHVTDPVFCNFCKKKGTSKSRIWHHGWSTVLPTALQGPFKTAKANQTTVKMTEMITVPRQRWQDDSRKVNSTMNDHVGTTTWWHNSGTRVHMLWTWDGMPVGINSFHLRQFLPRKCDGDAYKGGSDLNLRMWSAGNIATKINNLYLYLNYEFKVERAWMLGEGEIWDQKCRFSLPEWTSWQYSVRLFSRLHFAIQ